MSNFFFHIRVDLVTNNRKAREPADWRFGKIYSRSIDMDHVGSIQRLTTNSHDLETRGTCDVIDDEKELGWGIVRLYHDSEQTPGLYDHPTKVSKHKKEDSPLGGERAFRDEDCSTLCIPAVPFYLEPERFLGVMGEQTWHDIRHIRMLRTEDIHRNMVLLKFRNGKRAREWRQEWNGKKFPNFVRNPLFSVEIC